MQRTARFWPAAWSLGVALTIAPNANAQTPAKGQAENRSLLREGQNQTKALRINESIYEAIGFGNTFMVTTPEGNVIIDTSSPVPAKRHFKLLKAVS